jgi:polyhydroxyalkanoate synthesis repressor PhaR
VPSEILTGFNADNAARRCYNSTAATSADVRSAGRGDGGKAVPNEPIRIKRYPNRRFYASHTSKYVSLPEIEQMIRDGENVEIVDSATNEDITRAILIQLIAEGHPEKIALFPPAMLHSILRANGVMVSFLQDYFRNSLVYLDYFQKHGTTGSFQEPMHWMKAWVDGWSKWPGTNPPAPDRPDEPPVDDSQQVAKRVAELEKRIVELEQQARARV